MNTLTRASSLFVISLLLALPYNAAEWDKTQVQFVSHPDFPIMATIPLDWEARARRTSAGGGTGQWVLAPRRGRQTINQPQLNFTLRWIPPNQRIARLLPDEFRNVKFEFLGNVHNGLIRGESEMLAEIMKGRLYVGVQARAFSEEDRAILQIILQNTTITGNPEEGPAS
jgi:hypothetical protein